MNHIPFQLNKVHLGNCYDFLKQLPDKSIDLTLTDFPYGVGYDYDFYEDSKENLKWLVDNVVPEIRRVSKLSIITPGNSSMWLYPVPDWTCAWVVPAGSGVNKFGFSCWQPILCYGKDPWMASGLGSRPDIIIHTEASEKNGHSCPKPIGFWCKLLDRFTPNKNIIVMDPFNGSGTTFEACLRKEIQYYLGFEISENYVGITNKRIENYLNNPTNQQLW